MLLNTQYSLENFVKRDYTWRQGCYKKLTMDGVVSSRCRSNDATIAFALCIFSLCFQGKIFKHSKAKF